MRIITSQANIHGLNSVNLIKDNSVQYARSLIELLMWNDLRMS